jgi:hypothetical protein
MLMPGKRNLLIIGAFVAVCGLGIAGWARKNDRPVANTAFSPAANLTPVYSGNGPYDAQLQPDYGVSAPVPQPVYSTDGYYPSRMRPVYVRQNEVVEPVVVQQSAPAPRRVYQGQGPVYYTDPPRRRGRSKAHSVAIVAGTAGVGAAIGALAGGGKGAAIGALSGGGAGFVYDRLTHNK